MKEKILIYFDTCVLNKLAYIENYDHILKKLTGLVKPFLCQIFRFNILYFIAMYGMI